MAEQSPFDRRNIEPPRMAHSQGLLDQLNLPPALVNFLYQYQRVIWVVVTGIVIIGISYAAYTSYQDQRFSRGQAAYDAAQRAGSDNRPQLEEVVRHYGATPSGIWARVDLALHDIRDGNLAEAISQFEIIRSQLDAKSPLKPLVLGKLGVLYENTENFNSALEVYRALGAQAGFEAEALRALGRVYEQQGNLPEALAIYEQYLAMTATGQELDDPVREMIEFRLNQLKNQ
ncbi:YfgM family protein [Desulfobulbus alkaliphilus]|uniref:YfgM family protein n=1 Tax=Desulfobulbus alkaliphilus TaxID=869814 RepID=UPI001963B459|nr:tetratricopeptide repeat protein [Desulfobulbus alkaliphilus]MBM9536333.1 tetratricopeptide repeat protein [Desulfobulbus alkaliphilus]